MPIDPYAQPGSLLFGKPSDIRYPPGGQGGGAFSDACVDIPSLGVFNGIAYFNNTSIGRTWYDSF